jgi:hypothetical protein
MIGLVARSLPTSASLQLRFIGAIATTARIPTGNSMFSSFTGNLRNSSYSKSGSFHGGRRSPSLIL